MCDADGHCDGVCHVEMCFVWQYLHGCPVVSAGSCFGYPGELHTLPVGMSEILVDTGNTLYRNHVSVKCVPASAQCKYNLPGDRGGDG
jgi:hypothetical protein